MSKTITDRIDKYLVGEEKEDKKGKGKPPWLDKDEDEDDDKKEKTDESIIEPSEVGIKPGEYNNISTGLRRIQFRLEKANTPQKYVDAFEVIQQLITRFPLKAKIIWQAVANMYQIRFGSTGAAAAPSTEGETE
jgi:hypothetical protein